jgi:hypothetical protein
MAVSSPVNKKYYVGYLARNVPMNKTFVGRLPQNRKESLELTQSEVHAMAPKLKDIPIHIEHKGDPVGTVLNSWVTKDNDWLVAFTLNGGDEATLIERVATDLAKSKLTQQLSLTHYPNVLMPLEVSTVATGARPGSDFVEIFPQWPAEGYKTPQIDQINTSTPPPATTTEEAKTVVVSASMSAPTGLLSSTPTGGASGGGGGGGVPGSTSPSPLILEGGGLGGMILPPALSDQFSGQLAAQLGRSIPGGSHPLMHTLPTPTAGGPAPGGAPSSSSSSSMPPPPPAPAAKKGGGPPQPEMDPEEMRKEAVKSAIEALKKKNVLTAQEREALVEMLQSSNEDREKLAKVAHDQHKELAKSHVALQHNRDQFVSALGGLFGTYGPKTSGTADPEALRREVNSGKLDEFICGELGAQLIMASAEAARERKVVTEPETGEFINRWRQYEALRNYTPPLSHGTVPAVGARSSPIARPVYTSAPSYSYSSSSSSSSSAPPSYYSAPPTAYYSAPASAPPPTMSLPPSSMYSPPGSDGSSAFYHLASAGPAYAPTSASGEPSFPFFPVYASAAFTDDKEEPYVAPRVKSAFASDNPDLQEVWKFTQKVLGDGSDVPALVDPKVFNPLATTGKRMYR